LEYLQHYMDVSQHYPDISPWASAEGAMGGGVVPPGFPHMIPLMCFSTSNRLWNISTLTNHRSLLLRWLTLRGRGDESQVGTWVQSFFVRKWPEIFKKVVIFPKIVVSLKRGLSFSCSSWFSVS